ncbi:acyl-CoA-binding protein (ACBP)/diazepam binding inhibitor (DBI)/endozepine (EP) [Rhodosporidiobolus nylandii]
MATYSAAQFDKAVKLVGELPKDGPVQPSQDDKLATATVGENTTSRPGVFDLSGRWKWDAWTKQHGLSADEAKSRYVATFIQLLDKDGSAESAKLKAQVLEA